MSARWGVLIGGYLAGVFGASKLGVPFAHLLLATVTVVVIVALVVGADLLDARTRRFQAATDRMVRQCPTCRDPAEERRWRRWRLWRRRSG